MDQNSTPPQGDAPRGAQDNTPPLGQPTQPVEQPAQQPPTQAANPYAPPAGYGAPQQGPYPPQGGQATGYTPQPEAPPPNNQPQGTPPPGYTAPGYGYTPSTQQGYPQQQAGYPPPGGYPPQGYPPQGYGAPPKKRGLPVWGWILILGTAFIILLCALVVVALTFLGTQVNRGAFNNTFSKFIEGVDPSSPAGASFQFYSYLSSHNYQAAHDLLGSDLGKQYSVSELQAQWQALESSSGRPVVGLDSSMDQQGDSATVVMPITTTNGRSYKVTLTLQKAGSSWQITGADPALIPQP